MGLEQMRARITEIENLLETVAPGDEGFSDEQIEQVSALNGEFETLKAQIETAEKVEAIKAKASVGTGRKTVAVPVAATPRVQVGADGKDRFGGFNSTGDFINAVKKLGQTGEMDNRFKNVMYEKNGEDGGMLIPEDLNTAIQKKLDGVESLMSRVNTINVNGNTLQITLDESQPWNSGVQAYWVGEGQPLVESKPKWTSANFRLHKLGVMVKATDELLEDVTAMESYIKQAAPDAINYKVNSAILSGDGVGKPIGFLNSPYAVTVAKETSQTSANPIVAANLLKMYSRLLPGSVGSSAWIINAAAVEALMGVQNGNGEYIYLSPGSQLNQTPYGTLMGRPVIPMLSGAPGLGSSGDIVLADLKSYWMIKKATGIKQASSIHLHFDREITAFRFTMRLDGKVPFNSPVTTEFGGYQMSSIVKLADRP